MGFAWTGLAELLGAGALVAHGVSAVIAEHRLRRPRRKGYAWAVANREPGDPSELTTPVAFELLEEALAHRGPAGTGKPAHGWLLHGKNPRGAVVLVAPGWSDSAVGALSRVHALLPSAAYVIAWDPPGHGAAPGVCGLGATEPSAFAQLARRASAVFPDRPLVLYGWSMGAGVAIATAARLEADCNESENGVRASLVIAEAPYRLAHTPVRARARREGLPWWGVVAPAMAVVGAQLRVGPRWRGFDRAAFASRIAAPVAVLHGDADAVCPVEDGRAIAAAAPAGSFTLLPGGGHSNLWTEPSTAMLAADAVRKAMATATSSGGSRRGF